MKATTTLFFGRPFCLVSPWGPPETERQIAALGQILIDAYRSGSAAVIAVNWQAESTVHRILSIVASRLERAGLPVRVHHSANLISGAATEKTIVVDAPAVKASGKCLAFVSLQSDLEATAVQPDHTIAPVNDAFESASNDAADSVQCFWNAANETELCALSINALGIDVPVSFFGPDGPRPPFYKIDSAGKTESATFPGPWLARHAIGHLIEETLASSDLLRRLGPALSLRIKEAARDRLGIHLEDSD